MNFCRICKNKSAKKVGEYKPYLEYKYDVYDCPNCGCRFVWREKDVHESLHSTPQSPYSFHAVLASEVQNYWQHRETHKLRKFLSKTPKFKFIIDKISEIAPNNKSILEVGCSKGYLTAYFLLSGYNIIGVDISSAAIKSAIANFGNHFQVVKNEDFSHFGKFDVIHHVGTIGCVNDPIKFTHNLLDILKPNGKLLFNAPNLQSVLEMNAIWTGTPPPDLITIFPESFWHKFFLDTADVEITYEPYDHKLNLTKHLRKLLGKPYLDLDSKVVSIYNANNPPLSKPFIKKLGSLAFRVAPYVTRYFLPRYTSEMFICMTKR